MAPAFSPGSSASAALKVSASVPSVITNLAACYEATNQLDQAIKSYKSALEIDSNLPMALGNLGAIYQGQGNIQQAFPLLEKAVQTGKPLLLIAEDFPFFH